jgi:hypothetical protein
MYKRRLAHDCRDAGGRVTQEQLPKDAKAPRKAKNICHRDHRGYREKQLNIVSVRFDEIPES